MEGKGGQKTAHDADSEEMDTTIVMNDQKFKTRRMYPKSMSLKQRQKVSLRATKSHVALSTKSSQLSPTAGRTVVAAV